MIILVTGGSGFIGTELCRRLIDDGHSVVNMDLRAPKFKHYRQEWVCQDVADRTFMHPVDQIYNLACHASPPRYQKDPIHTMRTCVLGAINMLDLAVTFDCKILQASTSEVYGDPSQHPQKETYWGNVNPIGPRSAYDEGKRAAETLFYDYHRKHGVQIKVARIFNTYGPGMDPEDGRVVSTFVRQLRAGEPLTVYGDGGQTRSFCYIDDMVEGLVRLMNSGIGVTSPVNLGNPEEFTINALAALLGHVTVRRPLPVDDPLQRCPDISRAMSVLGWEPRISLREGLKRCVSQS
jgi:UDP-glucuronate decarboxylase